MATTDTFYFEDIYPDYESFKETTDSLELYEPEDTIAENFNQYLYSMLYMRYAGNSINYDVPQYFVYSFGIIYKDLFAKYKKQIELIKEIENLSTDELAVLTETISNGAYNPNDVPTEFWKPIGYISQQNAARIKNGKLVAYINAINAIPTRNIKGFLEAFIDLFTIFLPTGKYIY